MTHLLLLHGVPLQHQVPCYPFQAAYLRVSLPAKALLPTPLCAAYLQLFQVFTASIKCPTWALCLVSPAKALKGFRITLAFDRC